MDKDKKVHSDLKKQLKETGLFLLDVIYNAVVIIVLVILIRGYLVSPFRVVGSSMIDTLVNEEFILIDKLSYQIGDIERGDPVVFQPPAMSKDNPKFEEVVMTDENGVGRLDISDFVANKDSQTCANKLVSYFWFCKRKPEENDLVYFAPQASQTDGTTLETDWDEVRRFNLSKMNVKEGYLEFLEAEPNTPYTVRIYDAQGKEFFVKRIIGIPGDTVKLENGRVYLKLPDTEEFVEINESFLNKTNYKKTKPSLITKQSVFVVPEGHYFVMGDNRGFSDDSRSWLEPITQDPFPFVPEANIGGKVFIVLWPLNNIRFIPSADFF